MTQVPPQRFSAPPAAGTITQPGELGFLAWTSPLELCTGAAAWGGGAAGVLTCKRLALPNTALITNVHMEIAAAGVGLTAGQCGVGIYNAGGQLIGSTGDTSASWGANTLRTDALITPCICDTPTVILARWYNGTTPPTLTKGNNFSALTSNGRLPANIASRTFLANSGVTTPATLPAQLVFGSAIGESTWAAVS